MAIETFYEAEVKEDTKVLAPDINAKTFRETAEVIKKGTTIKGRPKYIQGLRKNEPFTYRLFLTDDNKLIFLNKSYKKNNDNMEKTEVKLGADAQGEKGQSYADGGHPATVINLKPHQLFTKIKIGGLVVGATAGFLYAKHKGKSKVKCIAIGALIGYAAAFVVDAHHEATVKKATGKNT